MPRVFSYVVTSDSGFAPNPFHGWLTLACCKPRIRERAGVGDFVVGLSSRCERVVYALEVEERLGFASYWTDQRFRGKCAVWTSTRLVERCGDNIYRPDADGDFFQMPSAHYDNENQRERPRTKVRDLSADAVLAGRRFVYFGGAGPELPTELGFLRVGRAHRSRFSDRQVAVVQQWFAGLHLGVHGRPTLWKDGDESWRATCGSC